jgi:hypothetical protein
MNQRWPTLCLDHKDGNKHNNAWANIRTVPHGTNQFNRGPSVNSRSGIKNLFVLKDGTYRVQVQAFGVRYNIGVFDDFDVAKSAAIHATAFYHGEFARNQ